jgi:hypothetical protein
MNKPTFSWSALAALAVVLMPGQLSADLQCGSLQCGSVYVQGSVCTGDAVVCQIRCNNGYDAEQICYYPDGSYTITS